MTERNLEAKLLIGITDDAKRGKLIRECNSITYTEELTFDQIKEKYGHLLSKEQLQKIQEISKYGNA